jgi:hypothetical protein
MIAPALLAELAAAGVRLSRDGDDLIAEIRPGAAVDPYREQIAAHKPALLVELLQRRIIAAVDVEPAAFDRTELDRLWTRWKAHEAAGETP